MQGKLRNYRDLREDDIYETLICVAQTNLIPETPAPTGYFNHGVLAPELQLAEGLFDITRSERFTKNQKIILFIFVYFQLLFGTFQGHLSPGNN